MLELIPICYKGAEAAVENAQGADTSESVADEQHQESTRYAALRVLRCYEEY